MVVDEQLSPTTVAVFIFTRGHPVKHDIGQKLGRDLWDRVCSRLQDDVRTWVTYDTQEGFTGDRARNLWQALSTDVRDALSCRTMPNRVRTLHPFVINKTEQHKG